MSLVRACILGLSVTLFACRTSVPAAPPGLSAQTFDGPGDRLSLAERDAFRTAANAVAPMIRTCILDSASVGVHSSEVVVRLRFRRDGTIYAVGFKSSTSSGPAADFLECVRGAVASMNLRNGPWESDHDVVYRFTTMVKSTWD